jgi:hypothetical protein
MQDMTAAIETARAEFSALLGRPFSFEDSGPIGREDSGQPAAVAAAAAVPAAGRKLSGRTVAAAAAVSQLAPEDLF